MTNNNQGWQPKRVASTNPPNCRSGVDASNNGRLLIYIPNDGNYIEILGHRIDGFDSFEAFVEHIEKYAVLEETVKNQKAEIKKLNGVIKNFKATKERQKAEIERLQNALFKQEDTMQMIVKERDAEIDRLKAKYEKLLKRKEQLEVKTSEEIHNLYAEKRTLEAMVEDLHNLIGKEFTCFVGNPHKVEHCPYLEELEAAKAEAVKEFADLSIKKICKNVTPIPQQKYLINMCIKEIEKTKKEMVVNLNVFNGT